MLWSGRLVVLVHVFEELVAVAHAEEIFLEGHSVVDLRLELRLPLLEVGVVIILERSVLVVDGLFGLVDRSEELSVGVHMV